MAKRKIKLNEDDLKSFLGSALKSSGFLTEDAEIIGFDYKTKAIKRGGDYYKDPADPSDKDPEIVKFITVFTETKKTRKKDEAPPDDE
jgi:hypothetical protein